VCSLHSGKKKIFLYSLHSGRKNTFHSQLQENGNKFYICLYG
jgi:hypothetical protein